MFEIVKCLREKSSPAASMSVETTKPEEVKKKTKTIIILPTTTTYQTIIQVLF